jgi:hypothetical protein
VSNAIVGGVIGIVAVSVGWLLPAIADRIRYGRQEKR